MSFLYGIAWFVLSKVLGLFADKELEKQKAAAEAEALAATERAKSIEASKEVEKQIQKDQLTAKAPETVDELIRWWNQKE